VYYPDDSRFNAMGKKEFEERLDKIVCIKGIKKTCKNWLSYYINNYPLDFVDGEPNAVMDKALAQAGFESTDVRWKYDIDANGAVANLVFSVGK
jgi:hypothetical protein